MLGYCGSCKKVCKVAKEDAGYGTTEMHGAVSHHSVIVCVSDCCSSDVYFDPECFNPITSEDLDL